MLHRSALLGPSNPSSDCCNASSPGAPSPPFPPIPGSSVIKSLNDFTLSFSHPVALAGTPAATAVRREIESFALCPPPLLLPAANANDVAMPPVDAVMEPVRSRPARHEHEWG